ncbi:MAG: hypothetical protein OSB70_12220 [Myxococcota bacterium]|nr:hypothetical protein [Myxococcota bacterium]
MSPTALMARLSRSILCLFFVVGIFGNAEASHFRFSQINWRPTGNPGEVVFTVSSAFRRGAPGTHTASYTGTETDGGLAVGDQFLEHIGLTRLSFGDGPQTPTLTYRVDAINTVEDWVVAHAIDPATGAEWRHTYAGTGPFIAKIASCCRTAVELNNPNRDYEISTIVDLSLANSSPVGSVPPIAPCPIGPCVFPVSAADAESDVLSYRLSKPEEAGNPAFVQPGSGTADALTIGSTGVLAWDSTEFQQGLYSTSITIEESNGGLTFGKIMLDFLINTAEFLGTAPRFDVPPTPENAEIFDIAGGSTITATIQCSDADAGELVTLGHLGLPPGATLSPTNAIGNPATAVFSWTPFSTQATTVGLTCVDSKGNSALPQSFSIVVAGVVIPPGPDRDNDLFCMDLSINQLIAGMGGPFNVIDNSLKPSAVLIGTPDPDLILAGGLGDQMYGLGGDDCIIGANASDYASGGDGNDSIWGWSGGDILEGDAGDDEIDGRDGNDFLLGGSGDDEMRGGDNEDWLRGGAGADIMIGGDDIDLLDGDAGDDQVFGSKGEDIIEGGPGDDILDGGEGNDVCRSDPMDTTPPELCAVFEPANRAPRIVTPIGDQSVDEAATLSILIVADDPDPAGGEEPVPGGGLAFTAINLPPLATLTDHGDRTATLHLSPGYGDAGSYPGVVIKVQDDDEPARSDIEVIDITITGGNNTPVLAPVGSQTLSVNEVLSIPVTATDVDLGNQLTFAPIGLPSFASFTDQGNGTGALNIAPGPTDAGQYHGILIRVVDDGIPQYGDSEIISIVVNAVANQAPVISPVIGDQSLVESEILQISIVGQDSDIGDALSFAASNLPAFASLTDNLDGTALLEIAPGVGDAGVYTGVVVEVLDSGTPGETGAEIITITVPEPGGLLQLLVGSTFLWVFRARTRRR